MNKTVEMRLNPVPFDQIKLGIKTIELRLNDNKRKTFQIGDTIIFINRETGEILGRKIQNLILGNSFENIFIKNNFKKSSAGFDSEDMDIDKYMNKYYSKEDILKHGLVAIILES